MVSKYGNGKGFLQNKTILKINFLVFKIFEDATVDSLHLNISKIKKFKITITF